MEEAFVGLEGAANKMGLRLNIAKTKGMIVTASDTRRAEQSMVLGGYAFEMVSEFNYLGSMVSNINDAGVEVRRRIVLANIAYFGLQSKMNSRLLSRNTKVLLYKTLIIPVLTYGMETLPLTKSSLDCISRFERKILRRIYGPVKEGDNWRRRYNAELYELYKEIPLTRKIKVNRLRWAGHLMRMGTANVTRRMLEGRGRQKNRSCIGQTALRET